MILSKWKPSDWQYYQKHSTESRLFEFNPETMTEPLKEHWQLSERYGTNIIWTSTRDFGTYRICTNASNKRPCLRSRGARGLKDSLSLYLRPYFVHVSSEGSGEPAHWRRLAWTFIAGQCVKYQNLYVLAHYVLSCGVIWIYIEHTIRKSNSSSLYAINFL